MVRTETPIGDMLRHAQNLQCQLIAARVVLRWMQYQNCVPEKQYGAELRHFLSDRNLPGAVGDVEQREWGPHPAAVEWSAAADALKKNADAPLPTK